MSSWRLRHEYLRDASHDHSLRKPAQRAPPQKAPMTTSLGSLVGLE